VVVFNIKQRRLIGDIMPPKGLIFWIVYCMLCTMLPKRVLTSQCMSDHLWAGTQNPKICEWCVICTHVDIWTPSYLRRSTSLFAAPAPPDCDSELIFINAAKPSIAVLRTRHSPYIYCTSILNLTQMLSYWVHNAPKRLNFENCILCIMHNMAEGSIDSPMKTLCSPGCRLLPQEGRPPASHDACWSAMTTNIV